MAKLDEMSRSEIYELIDSYVHHERDRMIMKRRLTDGITFEKLSEEFDLSVCQVKNIVYKHKERLIEILRRKDC